MTAIAANTAGLQSTGTWLVTAIALTAVAIVAAGFGVLRQHDRRDVRGRPAGLPTRVLATAEHTTSLDEQVEHLAGDDLVTALDALTRLGATARKDPHSSAAVIATWCAHLRGHSVGGDERVTRAVQQQLCTHLQRTTRRSRPRSTLHVDLSGAQLHDLDLDGVDIGSLNLARARLSGTTRLAMTCWGNLDATDARFDGDLLAAEAGVEGRLSLRGAVLHGVLVLEGAAVFGALDLVGAHVVRGAGMRDLVAGALRLSGADTAALFGGMVDLTRAVAAPVELGGDEFAGGLTVSDAAFSQTTRVFAGDEPELAARVRDILKSPLQV